MDLINHIFGSQQLHKCLRYEADFLSKYSKLNAESKDSIKNSENVVGFGDSSLSTGSGKQSL